METHHFKKGAIIIVSLAVIERWLPFFMCKTIFLKRKIRCSICSKMCIVDNQRVSCFFHCSKHVAKCSKYVAKNNYCSNVVAFFISLQQSINCKVFDTQTLNFYCYNATNATHIYASHENNSHDYEKIPLNVGNFDDIVYFCT